MAENLMPENIWRRGLTVINILLIKGVRSTTNSTGNNGNTETNTFFTDDMVTGLCAGFGFFAGLIIIICLIWCFCCGDGCGKDDKKRKVGPTQPPWKSRDESRVTTANTTSTRVASTRSSRRT